MSSRCTWSPVGNFFFSFLPLPSLLVRLKIPYLTELLHIFSFQSNTLFITKVKWFGIAFFIYNFFSKPNRCHCHLINYLNLVDFSSLFLSLFWLANISLDEPGNKSSLSVSKVVDFPCCGNSSSGISVSFSSSPERVNSFYITTKLN